MSSNPDSAIRSRDTGHAADSLLWQLLINNSLDAKNQRCSYGNGATQLVFKVLSYGRTDNQVTAKIFQIDGSTNFCGV